MHTDLRVTDGDTVGARPSRGVRYKVTRLLDKDGVTSSLAASYAQAGAFLESFGARLTDERAKLLTDFVSVPQLGKPARLRVLRRLGQVLYVWPDFRR